MRDITTASRNYTWSFPQLERAASFTYYCGCCARKERKEDEEDKGKDDGKTRV